MYLHLHVQGYSNKTLPYKYILLTFQRSINAFPRNVYYISRPTRLKVRRHTKNHKNIRSYCESSYVECDYSEFQFVRQ